LYKLLSNKRKKGINKYIKKKENKCIKEGTEINHDVERNFYSEFTNPFMKGKW
jgi:hypothetical protein